MVVDETVSTWVILGLLGLSLKMPSLLVGSRFNLPSTPPEAGRAGQSDSYSGFLLMPASG